MVSKKAQQFRLNSGKLVTVNAFRRLSEARQIEVMRSWFYQNFSDPIELPYNSAEGGYQWIWGGPFDAREELESEFGGIVKQVALEELVSELEHENGEWSGNPDDYVPDDDDYLFLSGYDSSPKDMLDISLNQIEEAAKLQLAGLMQVFVHKLLFANAISSLDAYSGDVGT
jgi:hypothetical protein